MLGQCLDFIKRYEIRDELRLLALPAMETLADSLRPYLIIGIFFVVLNFGLLLYIVYKLKKLTKS